MGAFKQARGPAAALVTVILLAGCTAPSAPPAPTPLTTSTSPRQYTPEEATPLIAKCLQDKGWKVETYPDDPTSIGSEIPVEQEKAYDADEAECRARYPVPNRKPQDWTPEVWERNYRLQERLAQCYRGLGYDIPPIPAQAAWIEGMKSGKHWFAGDFLPELNRAEREKVERACPQR